MSVVLAALTSLGGLGKMRSRAGGLGPFDPKRLGLRSLTSGQDESAPCCAASARENGWRPAVFVRSAANLKVRGRGLSVLLSPLGRRVVLHDQEGFGLGESETRSLWLAITGS